ncbi:hypothetical protein YPPY100_3861 [Yersinia pestis PY-100]|nr:hypothetical protein YPPY100_3861 [Yersinia pestis PY-100]
MYLRRLYDLPVLSVARLEPTWMYLRRLYDLPVLSVARLEPTWMYLRRLYDLPVLSVADTLSITSSLFLYGIFYYH